MYIWIKHSSAQIFKSTRMSEKDSTRLSLHAARNSTVTAQIALREYYDFEISGVTFSVLPDGVKATFAYQDYITYNDGTPYPDKISSAEKIKVSAQATQGIWVFFEVSKQAEKSNSRIFCTVHTSAGDFVTAVALSVYNVTIPDPKDSDFGHEYFMNTVENLDFGEHKPRKPLNPFYSCERYSDKCRELLANYAKALATLRVNSLIISPNTLLLDAGSTRINETEWNFDFTLFDKYVETFLSNGSFRYITLGAQVYSVNGKLMGGVGYDNKYCEYVIFTPDADLYAKAYYSAMYNHFKEKGWLSMLQTHIEDEPHTTEYWLWARKIARECMPGVPCGEPIDMKSIGQELAGECNFYVPRLEVYDDCAEYYRNRQAAGDTVWCYSCCFPEEPWWLNKFIDLPHSYSRLIKWACYSQGITGFLHWGFNFWGESLYGMNGDARFKGDGFIVYPDVENNSVKLSARGIETRDGIQDWEILNLLGKQDENTARAISRRVARTFRDFWDDADLIEQCRAEVLELLDNINN